MCTAALAEPVAVQGDRSAGRGRRRAEEFGRGQWTGDHEGRAERCSHARPISATTASAAPSWRR